jgi:hypothetical protein
MSEKRRRRSITPTRTAEHHTTYIVNLIRSRFANRNKILPGQPACYEQPKCYYYDTKADECVVSLQRR